MSLKNMFRIVFLLSFLSISSVAAFAQGIIVPRPCDIFPRCPRPIPRPVPLPVSLPVRSISLDTKIRGQVAVTRVTQVFENRTNVVLEGTYFFPLPEGSAVEEFAIWENGKKLTGEVRSREEARRIYDEIVRSMRDPGLLEYAGKDLLQASIFPIPANSDKKIELVYSQVLDADSGTVSYHYPLGKGRALWRRGPGVRSGDVPQTYGTVSGRIEIEAKEPLRNIYSPSHSIDVSRKGELASIVTFESKGDPEDFRLFFGLSKAEFGVSLLTYREAGKDGYFLLMISPNDESANRERVSKDIIFVLDVSGSMQDDGKLEKARPALNFGIKSLERGDRFNVISFSGEERLLETGLLEATDANKAKGVQFVNELKANGGTNINDALSAALGQFDGSERPKMVVLLTDGLPTVGEQDADKIAANVSAKKVKGLRLFTFGVGYDVNTRLLDKLGSDNSGFSGYIEPKEDLEVRVSDFFGKVNSPVLSDLELDFATVAIEMQYPRRIPDIFRGSRAVMIGRYTNPDDVRSATIRLKGLFGKESRVFTYREMAFPLRTSGNDFLPRLWASRRVGWLIEQIRINGESKELKDEVVDLGTRFGIVTPYTSYLATDGSFRARETEGNRFRLDPSAAADVSGTLNEVSGRDAVKLSVQQRSLQSNVAANATGGAGGNVFLRQSAQNQFVGNKNFINDGGVWTDTEFEPSKQLKEVVLKFGSDEYFDTALKEPELARYFSIGNSVVVVWNGRVYKVTSE